MFWVELPSLYEEETTFNSNKKETELKASKGNDDNTKNLYGEWI